MVSVSVPLHLSWLAFKIQCKGFFSWLFVGLPKLDNEMCESSALKSIGFHVALSSTLAAANDGKLEVPKPQPVWKISLEMLIFQAVLS